MTESVRWTLTVSKETDATLRDFLAHEGVKKGDLSKFVDEAVRVRLMKLNIAAARARNAHLSAEEIDSAVEQALAAARGTPAARAS